MVIIVAVEVVKRHAECSGPHECIELLVEEPDSPAEDLVAVVSAERALFRLRVVLLADFGHPEQLIVVEKVAREHDDVRRLEELLPAPCIDEAYARHLAVVI